MRGPGNVTAEARPGGTYGYTYNAAGRMSEFLITGMLQASYKCDAMGRQAIRTLTTPTPVTIHSIFDSDGRRIAEYRTGIRKRSSGAFSPVRETSGALIREYVWNGWGEADQKTLQWSVFPPNARARLRGPGSR